MSTWIRIALGAALSVLGGASEAQERDCAPPLRLHLDWRPAVVFAGDTVNVDVGVVGDDGVPVTACRAYTVLVSAVAAGGPTVTRKVTLDAGKRSATVDLTAERAGLLEMAATSPGLQPAPALVAVKAPEVLGGAPPPERGAGAEGDCPAFATNDFLEPWRITLFGRPRQVLANGRDAFTIDALITSGHPYALRDIRVSLQQDQGELSSPVLTIPRCQSRGSATLTATRAGPVAVRAVHVSGVAAEIAGSTDLTATFVPPITRIALDVPSALSLLGEGALAVRLVDDAGRPVSTLADRTVRLRVSGGDVRLQSVDPCPDAARPGTADTQAVICIPAGAAEGGARILPLGTGGVTVEASSPGLPVASSGLTVSWPWGHLTLAALGGLVGGFVSLALRLLKGKAGERPALRRQLLLLPVGLVAGLLLYWLLLAGMGKVVDAVWLRNALSAFMVAVVGGVFSSEVLTFARRRFGLG